MRDISFRFSIVCLVGMAVASVSGQQTIYFRSGNGTAGGSDNLVHYLGASQCGAPLSLLPFTALDFQMARNGPLAHIPSQSGLPALTGCQPPSGQSPGQWIVVNGAPDKSALYAIRFDVTCPGPAELRLCWRVDDSLGDYGTVINPDGLYVTNSLYPGGATVLGTSGGGYPETCRTYDFTGLLASGENWLYLYVRDGGCAFSGVSFCGTWTIQAPAAAWLTGVAFSDSNCNGTRESGEPVLPNATLIATNVASGQPFSATTDANGNFSISGVPFGTYALTQNPISGYKTPCQSLLLTVANCVTGISLPYCPCPPRNLDRAMFGDNGCWQVISTPPGVPGALPRPVSFIPAFASWTLQSGWMSALPTGHITAPAGEYVYECCFCLDERFSNPLLNLCVSADNSVSVYLNGVFVGNGATFIGPCAPVVVNDPLKFRPGENCVRLVVTNLSGPSGVNVNGQMTATNGDCCGPVCPCVPAPRNMYAWWMMDETAGTLAYDSVLGQDLGTHNNGPAVAVGQVNAGRVYDGVNDFTEVPTDARLNVGTGPFSIDAWIRTSDLDGFIVSKASLTPNVGYHFYLNTGQLRLGLEAGLFQDYSYAGPSIADGKWHHVAATVRQNSPFGVKLYVDGVPQSFSLGAFGNLTNSAPLRIGAAIDPLTPDSLLAGRIDEVEFFKRVLTPAEVYGIWRAGSRGKCRAGGAGTEMCDMNCDGALDFFDIDAFVLAIANAPAYEAAYPSCFIELADANGDGAVNNFDIDDFVELLVGP